MKQVRRKVENLAWIGCLSKSARWKKYIFLKERKYTKCHPISALVLCLFQTDIRPQSPYWSSMLPRSRGSCPRSEGPNSNRPGRTRRVWKIIDNKIVILIISINSFLLHRIIENTEVSSFFLIFCVFLKNSM